MISNPYLFYYQKIILKIFANINKPQISMLKDPIYLVYLINLYFISGNYFYGVSFGLSTKYVDPCRTTPVPNSTH